MSLEDDVEQTLEAWRRHNTKPEDTVPNVPLVFSGVEAEASSLGATPAEVAEYEAKEASACQKQRGPENKILPFRNPMRVRFVTGADVAAMGNSKEETIR